MLFSYRELDFYFTSILRFYHLQFMLHTHNAIPRLPTPLHHMEVMQKINGRASSRFMRSESSGSGTLKSSCSRWKYFKTPVWRTPHIATNYSHCNFQGKSLRRMCNGQTCRRSGTFSTSKDGNSLKDVAWEVASKSSERIVKPGGDM